MKKVIYISILIFFSICTYSQNNNFELVKKKLKNDKEAFLQFKYLGILNCLDNELKINAELFNTEFSEIFNGLFALPRLIDNSALKKKFDNHEELYNDENKLNENKIEKCRCIYSSAKSRKLFVNTIFDESNFYQADDIYISKDDIEQNMLDYLEIGKINADRFK